MNPINLGKVSPANNRPPTNLDPTSNSRLHFDIWNRLLKKIEKEIIM